MSWIDLLFLALILGVAPLYSLWGYRKLERDLEAGRRGSRVCEYAESIVLSLLFGLPAIWTCIERGRPLEAIGLSWPSGPGVWPALALTGAIVWFLTAQLRRVRQTDRELRGAEQIESVRAMLPETARERRWFAAAALSAGVFEEVVYRGYLIALFDLHLPLFGAVLLSSVAFAWIHIYQGWGRLPTIFVGSLVAAALLVWTGSLLLPVILHAFIDINSSLTARAVLDKRAAPAPGRP